MHQKNIPKVPPIADNNSKSLNDSCRRIGRNSDELNFIMTSTGWFNSGHYLLYFIA